MKTNTQIITETLGTTLIDYYAELKIEFDRKLPYNDTIGEIEAKIQAHKQARREELEFLKKCLVFDEGEDREDAENRGMELEFDQMIEIKNRIKAIELELAYVGGEE